MLYNITNIIFK